MGKRVSNKKGSGGARSRRTWARRNRKIWRRRELKEQEERNRLIQQAIDDRNARITNRVKQRKPSLLARAKEFFRRRT